MAGLAYRVWFGDRSATQEELDRIEEIVVEQEMDLAWEARIRMYVCLDEKGHWKHGAEGFAAPLSRVRVELRPGGDAFVALIDGPVAALDSTLSSQPGASSVTIVVRDDSVLMNRKDDVAVFEGRRADEVARTVFAGFKEIGPDLRIDATKGTETVAVQHGTAITLLRRLARAHGFHAYVLPGPLRGTSVGCFQRDPAKPGKLAPLVLLGDSRNVADIEVRENSTRPQRTVSHTLRLGDQQIVTAETKLQDLALMRPLAPLDDAQLASQRVSPQDNDREDPAVRATAQTRLASYAYTVTGRVVPGCYPGVLAPYERVEVQAGPHAQSGAWLLTKVTHRITPSVYTQEFQAKADSKEDPTVAPEQAAKPGGLSFQFSASLSIF